VRRAGWDSNLVQEEPDEEGTQNDKAASMYDYAKRVGRPGGSSGIGGSSNAVPTKKEERSKKEYEEKITVLQRWWRARRGRFTSRGTAIVAPRAAARARRALGTSAAARPPQPEHHAVPPPRQSMDRVAPASEFAASCCPRRRCPPESLRQTCHSRSSPAPTSCRPIVDQFSDV
jgi:hypothetical protein